MRRRSSSGFEAAVVAAAGILTGSFATYGCLLASIYLNSSAKF